MANRDQVSLRRQIDALFSAGTARGLSDGQLLSCFAGDRGEAAEVAFSALVERHGPMVLRICRGILRDEHRAQDAFQATFLVLVHKSGALRVHRSLGPWLQQVAYRAASCARTAEHQRRVHERRAAERSASRCAVDVDDSHWESVLHEEIDRLPERYRYPIVLCDLEGCTHDQAAVQIGCPVGTVKSRLSRGRERLRQSMVRRGYPRSRSMDAPPLFPVVTAALRDSTIQSALRLALARSASDCLPVPVRALVRRVLGDMARARATALALSLLVLATVAGIGLIASAAGDNPGSPPASSTNPVTSGRPVAGDDRADPHDEPGRLSITGRVVMPDGSPVPRAIVESPTDPPSRVLADDSGRFRIHGVFSNGAQLHARRADRRFQATLRLDADDARVDASSPLELRLEAAIEHVVTVVAGGLPVEDVEVLALGRNGSRTHGMTGERGNVTLRLPAKDPIRDLVAWHRELGVAGVQQREEERRRDMHRLALLAPKPHRIRVVDLAGRGVAGLELSASFRVEGLDWIAAGGFEGAHVRTDAEGFAAVPWAPREKLQFVDVVLGGSEWKIDRLDHDRIAEGLTTVRVRREHAVEGRLIMPPGAGAEGILVLGHGFGPGNRGHLPRARARRDGSFTLRVPSGHAFLLGVADREWASDPWTGTILDTDSSKPAEIALRVYRATPLTIRVTRGPRRVPVADAWVFVESLGRIERATVEGKELSATGRVARWWKTDASGVAEGGVGKGEQLLTVSSGAWREQRTVQVTGNAPIEVEFHRAWEGQRRVTGRLMQNGVPYERSRTLKAFAWSVREPLLPLEFEPRVRPDGTFEVEFDAARLSLFFTDTEKGRAAFGQVGPAEDRTELAMTPTATYAGTLLDENERPLEGVRIRLGVQTSRYDAVPSQRADDAGRFRFEGIPAGVPLEFRIEYVRGGPEYYVLDSDRVFEPREVRENDRPVARRLDPPAPAAPR